MNSAATCRAVRLHTALFALGILLSPAGLALSNADFSELRVEYADRQALPGWIPVLTDGGSRPDAHVVVEAVDFAYDGVSNPDGKRGNVAYFDTLTDGFGENKLDQCVEFDGNEGFSLDVSLRGTHLGTGSSDSLAVRANTGFFPDMATCEASIANDNNADRLKNGGDRDTIFDATLPANEWITETLTFDPHTSEANAVRISLRARDRGTPSDDRRIYFGGVEVSNGTNAVEVVNGNFDRVGVAPGQYLVQDGRNQGWWVVAGDLRVEQHPEGFAASGVNVLRYGELVEGFGDSRLDQCVALPQFQDFGVSLKARSDNPGSDLRVRVAVAFFGDANCPDELDELDDADFQVNGTANTWQLIETSGTALSALPPEATHARISLRARDRTELTPAPLLYLDDVRVRGALVLSPAPGSYSDPDFPVVSLDTAKSEPLEVGWTVHYTLTPEPADPTISSAELTSDGVEIDRSGWLSIAVFDGGGTQVGGITRAYYQILIGEPPAFIGLADAASGVVDDATDPVANDGLSFELSDAETDAAELHLEVISGNPAVVPDDNLALIRDGDQVTLRIVPISVGFADILMTLEDEHGNVTTQTLSYAASAHADPDITHTRWYTGRADLSTAISLDGSFIMVFDDEGDYERSPALTNGVLVYDLSGSGAPLADLSALVDAALNVANPANCALDGLPGLAARCSTDGEVDYEAAMRVDDRIYVTGSHSNNRNGRARPDRWRFFAADVSGSGAETGLDVQGYYQWLREDLRTWDAGNGHGFGADHFGLVASSNAGVEDPDPDLNQAPESDNLNGFSIEGLTLSPDDSAAWFGFRAPLVAGPDGPALSNNSPAGRTHALIVVMTNYAAIATAADGGSKGSAVFDTPIRLDLGGRGIREMRRDENGHYLIIAGPPNSANGVAPRDFRLFIWDGSHEDGFATNLVLREESLASFSPSSFAGSPEGIAVLPDDLLAGGEIELVSDNGDVDFYGSGTVAKDLAHNAHKKFRIDRLTLQATLHAVSASPTTGGQVVCEAASVQHGASTSCTATPYFGYEFSSWTNCAASTGNLCEIDAVTRSLTVGATFTASATPGLELPEGPQAGQILELALAGVDNGWIIANAAAETAVNAPAGFSLPHGLVSLRLVGGEPGSTAVVQLVYPQALPSGTRFYKYGPTTPGGADQWYEFSGASISGNTITLTLVDGGAGDHDGVADGVIVDPGAPVVPLGGGSGPGAGSEVKSIPVMAPWAMVLLVLALMGVARRHRRD